MDAIIINDERCTEYGMPGHPERPSRVGDSLRRLKGAGCPLSLEWRKPGEVQPSMLERAHTPEHIQGLKGAGVAFDGDTPAYPGIYDHAIRSVGAAVEAVTCAETERVVFSLMRPPGHHATQNRAMGFCYLNSMAIAILEAQARGARRVAVFDFDVHHGNGTEAILLGKPDTLFISIHQHPCYPGTGTRNLDPNCFNYPVAPNTRRAEWCESISSAFDQLAEFEPDMVGVSAGFDAYAGDPLAQGTLLAEDFHWIGSRITELGVKTFSLLEGGYSDDLPELIEAYLTGLAGKPFKQ